MGIGVVAKSLKVCNVFLDSAKGSNVKARRRVGGGGSESEPRQGVEEPDIPLTRLCINFVGLRSESRSL